MVGDEVSGLIGDIGTHTSRFGFAGEDAPKHVFRTTTGCLPLEHGGVIRESRRRARANGADPAAAASAEGNDTRTSQGQWFVGDECVSNPRPHVEMRSPLEDGLYKDWDLMENLWEHAFARMRVEPSAQPILCSESSWSTRAEREKYMELLFETMNTPAVYIAKSGMLSTFAAGRRSALICDFSYGGVSVTPVVEGYVLNKAIQRNNRGVKWLGEQLTSTLQERSVTVEPRYACRRGKPVFHPPNVHESFANYWREDVTLDIVAGCLRVPSATGWPNSDESSSEEEPSDGSGSDSDGPSKGNTYELPDGNIITCDPALRDIPDALYLKAPPPDSNLTTSAIVKAQEVKDIPSLCWSALNASDADFRKELAGHLVLVGGGSLLPGAAARVSHDMRRATQHLETQIVNSLIPC